MRIDIITFLLLCADLNNSCNPTNGALAFQRAATTTTKNPSLGRRSQHTIESENVLRLQAFRPLFAENNNDGNDKNNNKNKNGFFPPKLINQNNYNKKKKSEPDLKDIEIDDVMSEVAMALIEADTALSSPPPSAAEAETESQKEEEEEEQPVAPAVVEAENKDLLVEPVAEKEEEAVAVVATEEKVDDTIPEAVEAAVDDSEEQDDDSPIENVEVAEEAAAVITEEKGDDAMPQEAAVEEGVDSEEAEVVAVVAEEKEEESPAEPLEKEEKVEEAVVVVSEETVDVDAIPQENAVEPAGGSEEEEVAAVVAEETKEESPTESVEKGEEVAVTMAKEEQEAVVIDGAIPNESSEEEEVSSLIVPPTEEIEKEEEVVTAAIQEEERVHVVDSEEEAANVGDDDEGSADMVQEEEEEKTTVVIDESPVEPIEEEKEATTVVAVAKEEKVAKAFPHFAAQEVASSPPLTSAPEPEPENQASVADPPAEIPKEKSKFFLDAKKEEEEEEEKEKQIPTTTTAPPPPPPPSRPSAAEMLQENMKKITLPDPSTIIDEESSEKVGEFLEAVRDVTFTGSVALLKGLRWGAANALTASLPKEDREVLLDRMAGGSSKAGGKGSSDGEDEAAEQVANDIDEEEDIRGSVSEEIAVAVREEVRQNEKKWQAEKERITEQIQQAANERVATELAVQQQRLKEERMLLQGQLDEATRQREADLKAFEEATRRREEQLLALQEDTAQREEELSILKEKVDAYQVLQGEYQSSMQKAKEEQNQKAIQEETYKLQAVESLLQKRQQQQKDLEEVEENLRQKAKAIQAEKEEIEKNIKEIEAKKKEDEVSASGEDVVPHLSPKEYRALSPEERGELKARRAALRASSDKTESAVDDEFVHPILGPVIKDLGHKRIHLVTSGKLGTIPIWKKQRIYSNNRARSMANDKRKTMDLGFPGIICLHEDTDGKLSILDGQHRVGMMQSLREMQNKQAEADGTELSAEVKGLFDNILVEVYPQPSDIKRAEDHAEKVFAEINKAEPVKLVDMPGVASAADRKIITEAVTELKKQFPKMFSPSQRCRVPNVNIDNMRNAIFGANVLRRQKIKSTKQLLDWLIVQNAAQGDKYVNDEEQRELIKAKAWEKASTFGFYLGLDSSWLYL